MISSLPVPVRQQSERKLLKKYHDKLCQDGVEGYIFEPCWDDYLRGGIQLDLLAVMIDVFDLSTPYGLGRLKAWLPRIIAFSEDHPVINYLED